MSSFARIADALGRGDPALARRMAIAALLAAGPTLLAVAIALALGPGR